MEKLKKALSALVLLLVGSAIPAQIGAMVSGSNTYEDNCGNSGSVTVTKGPVVGGAQLYHVVLNAKDWAGVPFIVEQTMVAGIPAQGTGNWLLRVPGDNNGWFDSISADGNPTHGLTHASRSPNGGSGTVYRGPQQ